MRILLISDINAYSTADVFNGYINGLCELKIPFDTCNMVDLIDRFSPEYAYAMALSKLLMKENAFTYVFYVAGTTVPKWFLESTYDKKSGFIATDDPHSGKMLLDNLDLVNYYFTNEKGMTKPEEGLHYLPTAVSKATINMNKQLKNPLFESDVCFIGSVYPNRVEPLERAIRWCRKNKKKINIIGPIQGRTTYGELFVPESSIIHEEGKNGILDNIQTIKYYANSKVVINMDRPANWSPAFIDYNPHQVNCQVYSGNPRMYEIAACKAIQLYVEPRQEAIDIFDDNIYWGSTEEVEEKLEEIFSTPEKILKKKLTNCFNIVNQNHTYTHRTAKLIKTLIEY
jgi:hypothetical protein